MRDSRLDTSSDSPVPPATRAHSQLGAALLGRRPEDLKAITRRDPLSSTPGGLTRLFESQFPDILRSILMLDVTLDTVKTYRLLTIELPFPNRHGR